MLGAPQGPSRVAVTSRQVGAEMDAAGTDSAKLRQIGHNAAIEKIGISEIGRCGADDAAHFFLPCANPRNLRENPEKKNTS